MQCVRSGWPALRSEDSASRLNGEVEPALADPGEAHGHDEPAWIAQASELHDGAAAGGQAVGGPDVAEIDGERLEPAVRHGFAGGG
jgi:hypothetical protein